ncbi:MAG: DNA mismatch repair protein MutL [Alphaproteobacteria bacterium]|jgi:DNA mismatch repair protein MutL
MLNTDASEQAIHKPIKILPPQLANQIAAGEVVERPASVVKELLENSLDAGATEILIDIEQGGQKRILIRDNGAGIVKEQLALALSRHATSKISNIDDLEHITSMGFRGEALASISSVSRLTLTSKPRLQSEAWQAIAEGQQMQVDITPAAHPDGTSIEVLDLFFNTPARRKFLRTGKTEFQQIEYNVKRIALTRPDVQFVLNHNQKVCCRYLRVKDVKKRIEQVCGKNMLLNCTPIDYCFDGIVISGWCSKLGHGVATRDLQYTFVNGRMMKDKLLAHALRQVYEDTLPPQTFASYVLYLQVAPDQIDVNVHPAKHEVRFHQSRQVHDIVFKAVNDAISRQDDIECVNDELGPNVPSHNYIQALSPSIIDSSEPNANKGSSASYSAGGAGYRLNTPTRGEIKASNDFYASINAQSDSADTEEVQQVQSLTAAGLKILQVPPLINSHYVYSAPYIVFGQGEHIQVLPITTLLTSVVSNRLARSTLAQPLLMPVSIENNNNITQKHIDEFTSIHMIMSVSHQKLILKQVPSELRHLPWASIFGQLVFSELSAKKEDIELLAGMIACVWLSTLEVTNSMLDGWMSEIGIDHVPLLCQQYGKSLHLATWMLDAK